MDNINYFYLFLIFIDYVSFFNTNLGNMNQVLNLLGKIKTPPFLLARHSVFTYSLLFNKEIEPSHNYSDRFFTILSYEFQKFLGTKDDLFLLEASPRTGKTEFLINIFLTFLIGNRQDHRFLLICSNQVLKKDLRRKIERVCRSKFFQKIFPRILIDISNDTEMIFSNGNSINFTTTNSSVPIGAGFHFIFLIDYLNSDTMRSTPLREEAFAQLQGFLSRTQHNPATKIIVDNQRLGVEDLSAYLTKQYDEMSLPYQRLTFPYQFDSDFHYKIGEKNVTFKEGEFLVDRFNDFEKRKIIARLGNFVYDVQFLQKARRARGDLVKREQFRFYKQVDLENNKFINGFMTTDLALSDKQYNDFNVFCFWLVDSNFNLYLVDMLRLKIKGLQAESALYNFYLKWRDGLKNGGVGCNRITFENTTNTMLTIQRYKSGFEVDIFIDGQKIRRKVSFGGLVKELARTKNKFSRAIDAVPYIEAGQVFLPSHDVKIDGVKSVVDDITDPLITEAENFREDDSHEHDDIFDNLIDAINEARTPMSSLEIGW